MDFLQSSTDFPLEVSLGEKRPDWGLSRWGGKTGLRFVPPDDDGFTIRGDRQRLVYKGRRRSHRFTILGDCSFEYDCILNKEPESNVITLFLEGAEQFDFFRQPDFVPDPFLKGSYAVYKKETLLGEGTGKLCHIHRPEIMDARGRRCWGDLAVIGNELRITIPEQWLTEASYPVIVDPTIGTTTIGSQITGPDPNNSGYDRPWLDNEYALNKYLVPQNGNGVCTAYVYCYNDETYGYATPCLYTNVNNKPYMKKSQNENEINVGVWPPSRPVGWRNNTFNLNGNITAGDNVWFGIHSGWFTTRFDYGGECYKGWFPWDDYPEYDGEPTPYIHIGPWDSYCTIKWSWYFNYTAITSQNYVRTLMQGVKLSDSRIIKGDYKRSALQTAGVNSVLSRFVTLVRNCAITAHNIMTISRLPVFYRKVTENIKATMANYENCAISRKCADDVKANSESNRLHGIILNVQDIVKGTDTQNFSMLFVRCVPDNFSVTHSFKHLGAFFRGLLVNAGSIAETTHGANYYRQQVDVVQTAGVVFRGLLIFVRIFTSCFVRDYLLRRFLVAREEIVLKSCITTGLTLESRIN